MAIIAHYRDALIAALDAVTLHGAVAEPFPDHDPVGARRVPDTR